MSPVPRGAKLRDGRTIAIAELAEEAVASPTVSRTALFDHPRGLWVLAGTNFWERVSFHGMQALLTLYMAEVILLPGRVENIAGFAPFRAGIEAMTGPLGVEALSAQVFGIYGGLVYLTPLLGGWLGDRVIRRRTGVILGGLLMTAGHICMAFEATFLLALGFLVLGAGLYMGNLSPQVTALYAEEDRRKPDAFQIYYVSVNIGAFVAPIVTGALAAWYSWHAGFFFAAAGMLTGLAIYLAGARLLPPDPPRHADAETPRAPLTAAEKGRVRMLWLLWLPVACFWVAQSQVWNVYNLWVRDHVQLAIGGFRVPVPWLQAFDGLSPVIVMPVFLALWQRQARSGREPDELGKMARGCFLFAAGVAWLAVGPLVADASGRVPILWAITFHLISNVGWLYMTPIALSLYADKAPTPLRGTMIAVNTAAVFVASLVSGRIGGLYETLPASSFWLIHAAIATAGGVAILALASSARRRFAVTD